MHPVSSTKLLRSFVTAAAILAAAPAFADRHSDGVDDDVRDDSLWSETESHRSSGSASMKVGISQSAGKIVIDGNGGRSGGAAYLSKWKTDWNDSFTVSFSCDFQSNQASRNKHTAVSGIAFGSDDVRRYAVSSCFKTGVMVQMVESVNGTSVEIVARKRGRLVASTARLPMTAGLHEFQVSWIADPVSRTVTVELFADGNLGSPILQLTGAELAFAGYQGGVTSALFGYSKGNLGFSSSFDDFDYSGDDSSSDDSDDSSWCDDDDHDDDHGGSSGSGSPMDAASFISEMEVASAANPTAPTDVLKAEIEDGTLEVVFRETASTVRVTRVSRTTHAVVSSGTRSADEDELEAMTVLDAVTASASSAINSAAASVPGSTVAEVELEEEHGNPEWSVKLRTAAGVTIERTVAAN